jgi:TonB family protein
MKRFPFHGWHCWLLALLTTALLSAAENDTTIQRMKLVKFVQPEFPPALRIEGIPSGMVALAISRDENGNPSDILVLESTHPGFTETALEAVRQWRFPATSVDALQQEAPIMVRVGFTLTGVVLTYSSTANVIAERKADNLQAPIPVKMMAELADKPRALHQQMPAYPTSLVGKDYEGTAKVAFYVDGEGRVRMPRVVESSIPQFGDAALAAVRNWRYEPPRDRGLPAVVAEYWSFQFSKRD